jgi:hypothetical protein
MMQSQRALPRLPKSFETVSHWRLQEWEKCPGSNVTLDRPANLAMPTKPLKAPARALGTLRAVFAAYRWRLLITYGLFNLENLLHLGQPLVLGWAIHDLLQSSPVGLTLFLGQHVLYLILGTARRMYDTRTFTRIYTDLASQLVVDHRDREVPVSRVAARSALSREIVDFFERDIATVVFALYSVGGSLIMLSLTDWVLLPCCLALLFVVALLSRSNGRRSLLLNGKLNDQIEREVEVIDRARPTEVRNHFGLIARWRILLSDREAYTFGLSGLLMFGLIATALVRCCASPGADAGQILTLFGYVLMYVGGVASVPVLVQQFSRLRDISRRIKAEN